MSGQPSSLSVLPFPKLTSVHAHNSVEINKDQQNEKEKPPYSGACYSKRVSHCHALGRDSKAGRGVATLYSSKKGRLDCALMGGCWPGEAGSWHLMWPISGASLALCLASSWKQGQNTGKVAVISQVLAISAVGIILWFPGLLLEEVAWPHTSLI